jgi:iterative type I PKS product template protein
MLEGADMSSQTTGIDVTDVKVDAPLIAQPTESTHLFRVSATADWSASSVSMSIFSVDNSGKRTRSHATLEARLFPEQRWLDEWRRNTHLILSRIEALNQGIHNGESHKLKRGMVYKLFGAVVVYSRDYQGMEEVVLDSERLEAVSTVRFQVDGGGFAVNPRWIDSLGGIAGFIMNGNDAVESDKQVFINHGWERLRIAEKLDPAKTYYAYNRMQLVEKTLYAGDTYILHEGRTVAIFQGVKFQGVPRQVLDHVLPPRKAASKASPAMTAMTAARATAPRPNVQLRDPPGLQEEERKPRSRKPARQSSKKPSSNALSGFFDHVLSIICQEVGVAATELKPESEFADFGLDSLLSLTITARIREELQRDLPSSLFVECPTVTSLQALLDDQVADSGSDGAPTPPSRSSSRSVDSAVSDATHITAPTPREDDTIDGAKADPDSREATLVILRQTIAEETGVPLHELTSATHLGDVGVDSLLALTITAKVRDLLGDAVPSTLFMENETLRDVERALASVLGLPEGQRGFQPAPFAKGKLDMESTLSSPPHATSILLSGNARNATAFLFLLPDGSGSATSYAAMGPCVNSKVAVYGLNCPWRKTAEDMTRLGVDMAVLAAKYVAEIQRLLAHRKQQLPSSHGRDIPFAIGGWSAGGIIAVEAARQLRGLGQSVDKLILLDSPNPIGLQNPPQRMYDFFDSIGIFGGGRNKMPDWLRAHFQAFIHILDRYEPAPLPDAPDTLIVYARDGVCKDPNGPRPEMRPDDPREMLWLLNNRTDFSADGWASLLGRDRLTIRVLDDVNHFSLMDPGPVMQKLGRVVGEFLA